MSEANGYMTEERIAFRETQSLVLRPKLIARLWSGRRFRLDRHGLHTQVCHDRVGLRGCVSLGGLHCVERGGEVAVVSVGKVQRCGEFRATRLECLKLCHQRLLLCA